MYKSIKGLLFSFFSSLAECNFNELSIGIIERVQETDRVGDWKEQNGSTHEEGSICS